MELEDLAFRAVDKWGVDMQLIVLIEEMSELTKTITKFIRYGDIEAIYEEYADVLIMMKQLEVIMIDMDENFIEKFETKIVEKMRRLAEKLDVESVVD
jgi:NTP pyrophosphatase (non-canonical NTP hydrolase)